MTLSSAIAYIESDLEVSLIPVVIGALQVFQKSPNLLGAAAAEAYILANAPAALLTAETGAVNTAITTLNTKLQALLAQAEKPAAS